MQRNLYVIKWPEGHRLHDLEVKLRGLSFKDLRKVNKMRGIKSEEDLESGALDDVFAVLSKRLVWWSLTDDDGQPVPTDPDTLADEDFGMMSDIIATWVKAVTGVDESGPLDKPSPSGNTFPEESIPMETS